MVGYTSLPFRTRPRRACRGADRALLVAGGRRGGLGPARDKEFNLAESFPGPQPAGSPRRNPQ